MKLSRLLSEFEKKIPSQLQEGYDNSGLQIGDLDANIRNVLLSLDITEQIVDEAIARKCNLIVSHHPLIFHPLKNIERSHIVGKIIYKCIENQVAIVSLHTNLDKIFNGVSFKLAEKLNLDAVQVLVPETRILKKIITFVPKSHHKDVQTALFRAGAGEIGNYDSCSFNSEGIGTFFPKETASPVVGEKGTLHQENEIKIEAVFPSYKKNEIISALKSSHPYEEVAYDILSTEVAHKNVGFGAIGMLKEKMTLGSFYQFVKEKLKIEVLKTNNCPKKYISSVAVCGGSGASLIKTAKAKKADAFITGDIKHHDYIDADGKICLLDITHHQSETYVKELLFDIIKEINSNFALLFSEKDTNPIKFIK